MKIGKARCDLMENVLSKISTLNIEWFIDYTEKSMPITKDSNDGVIHSAFLSFWILLTVSYSERI
jgi:hypothetical protein